LLLRLLCKHRKRHLVSDFQYRTLAINALEKGFFFVLLEVAGGLRGNKQLLEEMQIWLVALPQSTNASEFQHRLDWTISFLNNCHKHSTDALGFCWCSCPKKQPPPNNQFDECDQGYLESLLIFVILVINIWSYGTADHFPFQKREPCFAYLELEFLLHYAAFTAS
jgi:hypothetical protein